MAMNGQSNRSLPSCPLKGALDQKSLLSQAPLVHRASWRTHKGCTGLVYLTWTKLPFHRQTEGYRPSQAMRSSHTRVTSNSDVDLSKRCQFDQNPKVPTSSRLDGTAKQAERSNLAGSGGA